MSKAHYLEEAEAEFLAEISYYKSLQVQGADRFRAAVEEATARALTIPKAGLQYLANTRRAWSTHLVANAARRQRIDRVRVASV